MRIPPPIKMPISDALAASDVSVQHGAPGQGVHIAQQQNASCPAPPPDPLDPDADLGVSSEGVPWGIKAVQGSDPVIQQLARQYRNKVMYCVIDSGLDISNKEFNPNSAPAQCALPAAMCLCVLCFCMCLI
jgi:hypothetical protein